MDWFSYESLKRLVSNLTGRHNTFAQSVEEVFTEVYNNLETLDERVENIENSNARVENGVLYLNSAVTYNAETKTITL